MQDRLHNCAEFPGGGKKHQAKKLSVLQGTSPEESGVSGGQDKYEWKWK